MSVTDQTSQEIYDSLTYFDEIAITAQLGVDVNLDQEAKPSNWLRALVFVELRRQGVDDAEAKKRVQHMTIGYLRDYHADPVDPEDPDTEAGKGDAAPESPLSVSPTSASTQE